MRVKTFFMGARRGDLHVLLFVSQWCDSEVCQTDLNLGRLFSA